MLPQKRWFGKTAVILISIITIIFVLASLSLAANQNQHDNFSYLPIALKENATPTPTNTATATSTLAPINAPSATATPDFCGPEFFASPGAGSDYVPITGEVGRIVTITDLITGKTLGSGELMQSTISWSACPGYAEITVNEYLIEGHLLLVESNNPYDSYDTAWVVSPPPLPTAGLSPTPTPTSTPTSTPTRSSCGLEIEEPPIAGFDLVSVTGEIGRLVTVIDVTIGTTLGMGILPERDGHICPGFLNIPLNTPLVEGRLILAESDNPYDQYDAAWVIPLPPIPTVAVPTPTYTPTPTTANPFIVLLPNCGVPPNFQFTIQGFNWPQDETIALYWNSSLQSIINTGSQTSFSQTWQKPGLTDGTYEVKAVSTNHTATAVFTVPCSVPPSVTPTATTTATGGLPNLIISQPTLVSTPPIVAYQPVEFQVVISNTEATAVDSQFFVDIYIDPTTILTDRIPIAQSDGYHGVNGLDSLATRVLTITAPLGFANEPGQHLVYGMVDSLAQIQESAETDNISIPLLLDQTPIPAVTPTDTLPTGTYTIIGVVYRPANTGVTPLPRASVALIDEATTQVTAITVSDPVTGLYQFQNLPEGSYTVTACSSLSDGDGLIEYAGWRTNITLPYTFPVNIYTDSSLICPVIN